MEKDKWFDGYQNQSCEELVKLKHEYRIDSLVSAFEQAVQSKSENMGIDSLSEEERVILAIEALSREVNNGGFSQFFYNSSCEYVDFIVQALHLINCPQNARLAQEAINIIELPKGASQEQYQNKVTDDEDVDVKLESLDDLFYEYEEDIEEKLFEYIEANKEKINIVRKILGK